MRRDDHGIDHEAVERYRRAGHKASETGLAAAMAIVANTPVEVIRVEEEDGVKVTFVKRINEGESDD